MIAATPARTAVSVDRRLMLLISPVYPAPISKRLNPPTLRPTLRSSCMPPALPVEIWQQIFDEVLDDPVVQTSCSIDDFRRFIYAAGCESEVEARRLHLAAVCQSWRAIAESYAHRSLVISEYVTLSPGVSLYSVRRLCFKRRNRLHQRSKPLSAETLDRWSSWIKACQGLVVLDIDMGDDIDPTHPLKFLLACARSVKSLRSLRLRWDSSRYPVSLSLNNISVSYFGITTLELGRLPPSVEPLSLPTLQVLIIEISEPSNPGWDFSKWRLPCLQYLSVLLGNSWEDTPFELGVFQPFASHLVALHLTAALWGHSPTVGYQSPVLQSPVLPFDLNYFPSLQDLTLCNIPLLISTPLDIHHPLRTIRAKSWDQSAFFRLTYFPPNTFRTIQTITICIECHFWGYSGGWQQDPSPFNSACASLDRLVLEENISLRDKNGSTLEEWKKQVGWDDWFPSMEKYYS